MQYLFSCSGTFILTNKFVTKFHCVNLLSEKLFLSFKLDVTLRHTTATSTWLKARSTEEFFCSTAKTRYKHLLMYEPLWQNYMLCVMFNTFECNSSCWFFFFLQNVLSKVYIWCVISFVVHKYGPSLLEGKMKGNLSCDVSLSQLP